MENQKTTSIPLRNRHTAEVRAKARRYYLMGLTLSEISVLLNGCPVRTIEKWQKAEQWTKLKHLDNLEIQAYNLYVSGRTFKEIGELMDISHVTAWRYTRKVEANHNNK